VHQVGFFTQLYRDAGQQNKKHCGGSFSMQALVFQTGT